METGFGLWIPLAYADQLEERLRAGRQSRRTQLENLAEKLKATQDTALRAELRKHVESIQTFFEARKLSVRPVDSLDTAFDRFIHSRRTALGDNQYLDRLSRRLILQDMPDLWGDENAAEAFMASFFEDVAYGMNAPLGRQKQIIRVLSEVLNMPKDGASTSNSVRSRLETRVSKGWASDLWV